MCMQRYMAFVHDLVCLDVLSCLLGIFFLVIGMVLLKLKVLLCAEESLNFSLTCGVCCRVPIF